MTREEAIKELSYIADEMPSMECADWKEAISMAIKALEQEPCEDVVSRTEVLNLVRFNAFHVKSQIKAIENMPSVTPQEQKPMIEIDLYSVINQKYIEREVLDKISAEIKALSPEPTAYDVVDGNPVKDAVWEIIGDVRQIIDKYKAESEVKANGNEK